MTNIFDTAKKRCKALATGQRGALTIEQALFTSIGGTGCAALAYELASSAERGFEIVHRVMP